MKKLLLIMTLIGSLFAFEFTEAFMDFNKGIKFMNKGKVQKAQKYFAQSYAILKGLESKGKGSSQIYYMLGRMYCNGWGVETDLKKAEFYFKKAMAMGNRRVHCCIVRLYLKEGKVNEAKKELKYALSHKSIKSYCDDIDPNTLKIKGE